MMQDVATAKSDIAAFATGLAISPSPKSESSQQFGQLLQDQSAQHAPQQHQPKKLEANRQENKDNRANQSEENLLNERAQSPKTAATDVSPNSASQEVRNTAKDTSLSNTNKKTVENQAPQKQSLAIAIDKDPVEQDLQKLVGLTVTNKEFSGENTDLTHAMGELKLELQGKAVNSELSDVENESLVDDASVTEEWVALIENYQRLAEIASTAEKSVKQDQPVTLNIDQVITKNNEHSLIEKLTETPILTGLETPVESGDKKIQISAVIEEEDMTLGLINPKVNSSEVADTPIKTSQAKLPQTNINLLVQQALAELPIHNDTGKLPDENVQQQATDLLLAHPQFLQGMRKELQNEINKADIALDDVEETLNVSSQLLRTLLTKAETTQTEVVESNAVKVPELPKLETEKLQATLNNLDVASPMVVPEEISSQAEQSQITQTLMAPLVDKDMNNSAKKVSDINLLLALPDKKLTKVLEHIVGRILPNSPEVDVIKSDLDMSRLAPQIVVPKSADLAVATDSQAKEFIAALKSGIEEFKQQVAQGREPGLDLKSLITDAMAKSNDVPVNKSSLNVQQISQSISHVLDMTQSINRAIEHHQEQAFSAVQRDVAQIQGEQSKSLQFNQFEAKFEKAVNITKPEGHQQLAEKVRWMVNTKNLVADIRLDPAELGSVHVKVAMYGESATVNFVVQSQHARDAMDNATPKLREMLAEKGIELGQSSVEQESQGQSSQGEGELSQSNRHEQGLDSELEPTEQVIAQQSIVNGALGGIDYFV